MNFLCKLGIHKYKSINARNLFSRRYPSQLSEIQDTRQCQRCQKIITDIYKIHYGITKEKITTLSEN